MKPYRFLLVLPALLLMGAMASGQTLTVELTGVNGVNDGQYYVLPYDLTINNAAVAIEAICYDALHEVSMDQVWQANELTLSQAASEAVFSNQSNALQGYETVAYLSSWFYTDSQNMTAQNQIDLQHAIWDVFDPGAFTLPKAGVDPFFDNMLSQETTGMQNLNYNNYSFLAAIPQADGYQAQSFIIYTPQTGGGHQAPLTPEPGTFSTIMIGTLIIGASALKGRAVIGKIRAR